MISLQLLYNLGSRCHCMLQRVVIAGAINCNCHVSKLQNKNNYSTNQANPTHTHILTTHREGELKPRKLFSFLSSLWSFFKRIPHTCGPLQRALPLPVPRKPSVGLLEYIQFNPAYLFFQFFGWTSATFIFCLFKAFQPPFSH